MALLGAALAVLTTACGPAREVGFDSGADIVSTDANRDAADAMDTVDVPVDTGPPRCTGNSDCTSGTMRLCDLTSGRCVECLAGGAVRTCNPGNYCGPDSTCIPGCTSSADCDTGADGSVPRRCDATTHMCVDCMTDTECPDGTVCHTGTCVAGCSDARPCAGGLACCNGVCADLQSDNAHCGDCAQHCGASHSDSSMCVAGNCVFHCSTGYGNCDANANNGCEANLQTDPFNCGACVNYCAVSNTTATCTTGMCHVTGCAAGFADCNAMSADGCETNTGTDVHNCGMCGHACLATQICAAGTCTCPAGQTLCNGVCVDMMTSTSNCGACGTTCDTVNGQVCNAGTCGCPAGSMVCPAGPACVNLQTSATNCGACGTACPAMQFCAAGMCSTDIVRYVAGPLPASVTFVDVCAMTGATQQLANVDDALGAAVTIPFTFRFFDGMYTSAISSSNGYLALGSTWTDPYNYGRFTLPSTGAPRPALFMYSRDLHTRTPGVCFATIGTAPNRAFVWEMNDEYLLSDSSSHITAEAFLNEGSNTIDVIYQNLVGADGSGANVGMQNANATRSTVYENNMTGSLMTGLRVRFTPSGP